MDGMEKTGSEQGVCRTNTDLQKILESGKACELCIELPHKTKSPQANTAVKETIRWHRSEVKNQPKKTYTHR